MGDPEVELDLDLINQPDRLQEHARRLFRLHGERTRLARRGVAR